MDELLLAAYQHADWPAFAISHPYERSQLQTFGDGCPVNYACSRDDARFIDDSKDNYKRVQWVFEMIDRRCRDTQVRATDVLVELLEGKEEDIWLWVDGDEANLPKDYTCRLPKYGRLAAVHSLDRRRQPTAPTLRFESDKNADMRRRVQSESLPVRVAAIAWLTISSKTMKKLDHDYGFSDKVKWDLEESIWDWFYQLDVLKLFNDIPVVPAHYLKEFEAVMVANGHACLTKMLSDWFLGHDHIARWLYIQNVLFGENTDKLVNFMYRCGPNGELECKTCLD